jgi:hypothetical protein
LRDVDRDWRMISLPIFASLSLSLSCFVVSLTRLFFRTRVLPCSILVLAMVFLCLVFSFSGGGDGGGGGAGGAVGQLRTRKYQSRDLSQAPDLCS